MKITYQGAPREVIAIHRGGMIEIALSGVAKQVRLSECSGPEVEHLKKVYADLRMDREIDAKSEQIDRATIMHI